MYCSCPKTKTRGLSRCSKRPCRDSRFALSSPSVRPQRYRPSALNRFPVLGSYFVSNDRLTFVVSLLPLVSDSPAPNEPVHTGGGGWAGAFCGGVCPRASGQAT